METYFLGRAPYEETSRLQERLRERVLAGGAEVLLLCEHPPLLTTGKYAAADDILVDAATLATSGVQSVQTSRGGKVTYHGPGQLVAYPIVRLRRGIVDHIEWLAGAAVDVAKRLGIAAHYSRERVGVWVEGRKLAALGVHVSRRVTIHGMALNVTREATAPFARGWFIPCGEAGAQVTSLEEAAATSSPSVIQPPLTVKQTAHFLAAALCRDRSLPPPELVTTTPTLLSQSAFVE